MQKYVGQNAELWLPAAPSHSEYNPQSLAQVKQHKHAIRPIELTPQKYTQTKTTLSFLE